MPLHLHGQRWGLDSHTTRIVSRPALGGGGWREADARCARGAGGITSSGKKQGIPRHAAQPPWPQCPVGTTGGGPIDGPRSLPVGPLQKSCPETLRGRLGRRVMDPRRAAPDPHPTALDAHPPTAPGQLIWRQGGPEASHIWGFGAVLKECLGSPHAARACGGIYKAPPFKTPFSSINPRDTRAPTGGILFIVRTVVGVFRGSIHDGPHSFISALVAAGVLLRSAIALLRNNSTLPCSPDGIRTDDFRWGPDNGPLLSTAASRVFPCASLPCSPALCHSVYRTSAPITDAARPPAQA